MNVHVTAPDARSVALPAAAVARRTRPLSRPAALGILAVAAAAVITSILLTAAAFADELAGEGLGDGWLGHLVVALIVLPAFALLSVIVGAAVGMVVALFDRHFDFRALAILTFTGIALALLASTAGMFAITGGYGARAPILAVGVAHLVVALGSGWSQWRVAGVARLPAALITALLLGIVALQLAGGVLGG